LLSLLSVLTHPPDAADAPYAPDATLVSLLPLLQSHFSKDMTYTMSKLYPGLDEDRFTTTADFGIPPDVIHSAIDSCLKWFEESHPRIRYHFLLGILGCCKTSPVQVFAKEVRKAVLRSSHAPRNPMTYENQFARDLASEAREGEHGRMATWQGVARDS
jgi:hypothetical protein